MRKLDSTLNNSHPALRRSKQIVINIFKITAFLFLSVILASHEKVNPKIGDSHIDFYAKETSAGIRIYTSTFAFSASALKNKDLQCYLEEEVAKFYKNRNFAPAWTINYNINDNYAGLTTMLNSADYFGFPGDFFGKKQLEKLYTELQEANTDSAKTIKRIELEINASYIALKYYTHLSRGIMQADTNKEFQDFISALPQKLEKGILSADVETFLLKALPQSKVYRNLQNAVPEFVSFYKQFNKSIADSNDNIIAKSLYFTGHLQQPQFDSLNSKQNSLIAFQKKQRIEQTGKYNTETRSAIKQCLRGRYFQLALNLDRLRKLSNESDNYIFVNIPEFKLHVFENNALAQSFIVVVGKRRTPTPVLSSKIEKVVANPYWTVPRNIANNEMLHKIRKDSTYLKRNGYYLINNREEKVAENAVNWEDEDPLSNKYWIRQKNMRSNALGQVKFIFPNNYRVFVHDTPAKRYFKKTQRAYSHGCVRLEHPEKLAQYLAEKYIESEDSLDMKSIIAKRARKEFFLKDKLPIHIQYITCSPNELGALNFHKDIYNLDKKAIEDLFQSNYRI